MHSPATNQAHDQLLPARLTDRVRSRAGISRNSTGPVSPQHPLDILADMSDDAPDFLATCYSEEDPREVVTRTLRGNWSRGIPAIRFSSIILSYSIQHRNKAVVDGRLRPRCATHDDHFRYLSLSEIRLESIGCYECRVLLPLRNTRVSP